MHSSLRDVVTCSLVHSGTGQRSVNLTGKVKAIQKCKNQNKSRTFYRRMWNFMFHIQYVQVYIEKN